MKIKKKYILPCILSFTSFIAYLFTLSRNVNFGDSGEFITASYLNTVAHPPGYPLYTLVGHIFSWLPIGSVAFRINLMSAVFASLSIFFLGLYLENITKNKYAIVSASIFLGFSHLFWSQSVIAEVYTLMVFFIILLMYMISEWEKTKDMQRLYVIALIASLSLGNHILIVVFFPAFIYYIYSKKPKLTQKNLMMLLLFFLAGLLIYLKLPVSSSNVFNYGDMADPKTFVSHVTMKLYRERFAEISLDSFSIPMQAILFIINEYMIYLGLCVFGLFSLWAKHKKIIFSWMILICVYVILSILNSSIFTEVHYLPIIVLSSILMGAGVGYVVLLFPQYKKFVLIFVLLFPLFTLFRYPGVNMAQDRSAVEYFEYISGTMEQNSMYIAKGDDDFYPALYFMIVEDRHPPKVLAYYKSLIPTQPFFTDDLQPYNKLIYQAILPYTGQYSVYTSHNNPRMVSDFNKQTFPLQKFTKDKLISWLETDTLNQSQLLFQD